MTTETVEKVDLTNKSVYYPTRNTTHTTATYKINGVTYQEEINLKMNGEFLTTNYISKQNKDGTTSIVDSTSSEFLDIALHSNRTSTLTKTYNDIQETSKNLGENNYNNFEQAVSESGMNTVIETGNFNTVVPNRVIQDQKLAEQGATTLEAIDGSSSITDPVELRKNPHMSLKGMHHQYPSDALYDSGQDYLYIQQFKYAPPQAKNKINKTGGENDTFLGGAKNRSINVAVQGLGRGSNISESRGSVKLPIPNGLNVSNGVGWGEGRANAVEAGAFFQAFGSAQDLIQGKKNVAEIISENFKAAGGLLDGLKEDASSEGQASMVLSAVLAKAALSKMNINVDPAQFITRSTGMAINPNLELLFSGPKLRNFTFSFMFASHDEKEASEVRKIIRWFKQGMSPDNEHDARSQIYLGSPNVFRLRYMNSGRRIKGLNIFKICALTGCELDLAPSKTYQSYEDNTAVSMPPMIGMALSFTELTPIFSNDYTSLENTNTGQASYDAENKWGDESYNDLGLTGNDNIGTEDIGF